jgi:hypothetical protein
MEAHGAEIVSADAAELQPVSGVFGGSHVLKARGGFPHRADKSTALAPLLRCYGSVRMTSLRQRA